MEDTLNISRLSSITDHIQAPEFVRNLGNDNLVYMYFIALVVILLLMLALSVLPYILSGWWYIRIISQKVNELRESDTQRKRNFDKQRNLLFSDITHDIKTPITTIVGYSQALSDGIIKDPAKQHDYLNTIRSKSVRISELITMLFEFVKLDSAGFTLHQEPCDLAELVRENIAIVYTDFEERGIEVDFDMTEDECPIYADRIQMSRVITNLLSNAIRYIGKGSKVRVSLSTPAENHESQFLVSVADDGIPITEEFAKTIFNPFSRSDEARQTTSGGSGLGLSIAHKVAQMHGGSLSLNLNYGHGYEKAFELRVPVRKTEDNPAQGKAGDE